ncbi:hypothetical protein CK203_044246 [Vitis vinifera]|uniref:Uncharacterized protein n=1 Tax=Vitis vinifera TaxID=29760 RepID=A0A438GVB0_VITVI|nr:hypothetical protein CK203_044246 [Vitis vinifera]
MSGLKSADFCHDEQSLRLLGYANLFCIITSIYFMLNFPGWKLWNEDSMEAFIDGSRSEECFQEGILRCIQVRLLRVQELAKVQSSPAFSEPTNRYTNVQAG